MENRLVCQQQYCQPDGWCVLCAYTALTTDHSETTQKRTYIIHTETNNYQQFVVL